MTVSLLSLTPKPSTCDLCSEGPDDAKMCNFLLSTNVCSDVSHNQMGHDPAVVLEGLFVYFYICRP